ncbi:uncharacterized protein (DUF885 family) [Litorimonas taeanensis]|uniref:Uncharacterized protein (DUF885 family) n=1 Tax=Litorimonas taeanensis TaxID=568099 RepID=A0A420WJ63_9PROT|nr:DUF885 domain-containing protein [Litorimonas taeanensis]RKQ71053.1 uncharacterized protein (DUF885 family) [Litorimonas taeanensis]
MNAVLSSTSKSLLLSVALGGLIFSSTACTPSSDTPTRAVLVETESANLNAWFEARFEDDLARSPMNQTYLGRDTNKDRLDDNSAMALDEEAAIKRARLQILRDQFDIDRLDEQTRLSYRLFEYAMEDDLTSHEFSDHDYVFQHMGGPHTDLPAFMINFHPIKTEDDARDYIARLNQFDIYLKHAADRAQAQLDSGIALPKFVYKKIHSASENVISGVPFQSSTTDSPLLADFKGKVADLPNKDKLIQAAERALLNSVEPAYQDLMAMFKRHEVKATSDDGVWKLPNGEAYYAARLRHYTTTDLTADEIHEIGLNEVERIQNEMRTIMTQVGFGGSLREFFNYLRTDPKFVYPNTDEGRAAYMADATDIIDDMKTRLESLFITKPKADMIVKRVEPFREDTAFGAFYNSPALDGSRPGTYYVNLKDIKEQPKYLQQALAYHEGIPGHHMQIALAQELQGLPAFRTLGGHTAYIEGWALYAESLPAELGLYTDPYSDFGRLSMEIFRAARLVVDTGIHAKKWTREEAVQYYLENIPNPEGDVRAEIDRYIVWPGQATAYKIGMLKIQALRQKAETELGPQFNLAEFHDVILANGSVPLAILEKLVDGWVEQKLAK